MLLVPEAIALTFVMTFILCAILTSILLGLVSNKNDEEVEKSHDNALALGKYMGEVSGMIAGAKTGREQGFKEGFTAGVTHEKEAQEEELKSRINHSLDLEKMSVAVQEENTSFSAPGSYAISYNQDLLTAARNLYTAAYWTPDRPVDSAALWEALRDAAGTAPGNSPKKIEPPQEDEGDALPETVNPSVVTSAFIEKQTLPSPRYRGFESEGRDAAQAGLDLEHNPYLPGGLGEEAADAAEAWSNGFKSELSVANEELEGEAQWHSTSQKSVESASSLKDTLNFFSELDYSSSPISATTSISPTKATSTKRQRKSRKPRSRSNKRSTSN